MQTNSTPRIRRQRHNGFRRPTARDAAAVNAAYAEWVETQRDSFDLAFWGTEAAFEQHIALTRNAYGAFAADGWIEFIVRTSDGEAFAYPQDQDETPAELYGR